MLNRDEFKNIAEYIELEINEKHSNYWSDIAFGNASARFLHAYKKYVENESRLAENLVSQAASQAMPEPSQQLFTIAEVENFLERQKEICKQQYNLYCTDRELPISDVCRKMILEAPTPNIVKS